MGLTKNPAPEPTVQVQANASRHQYRVVFNEVAEAMQEVTSLHDSMLALRDGFIGVFGSPQVTIELTQIAGVIIMFLAGWVHRDVGAGNILWNGYLEHAKDGRISGADPTSCESE